MQDRDKEGFQGGSDNSGGLGGAGSPGSLGDDRMNQVGTDGDRRGLEQEELGGTQATAIIASHAGADGRRIHGGGRADDSRGLTDCSRAGGGGARGGDGELMSQGDREDPEWARWN